MRWRRDLRDSPIAYDKFISLTGVRPTGAGKRILDPARKAAVLARLAELEEHCTADPVEYTAAADLLWAAGPVGGLLEVGYAAESM